MSGGVTGTRPAAKLHAGETYQHAVSPVETERVPAWFSDNVAHWVSRACCAPLGVAWTVYSVLEGEAGAKP
jgi:hypothetical protein